MIVEITDTGIGIDPPQLSKIFEPFEQGDPDIQSRFGGLGLGLAICQAVLQAHHGSIAAASPGKGKGATFTVTLPTAPPAETPAPQHRLRKTIQAHSSQWPVASDQAQVASDQAQVASGQ